MLVHNIVYHAQETNRSVATTDAMFRNKENNPLPSHTRANGSVFGASKATPNDDFFTDSILEDTSIIPTPSPQKHSGHNARRASHRTRPLKSSKNTANTGHRSSSPQAGSSSSRRHLQPAPMLQRPKTTHTSKSDLITPPQSRDGLPLASPMSDVSSPPRGLEETYQRIEDEELIAGQERESDEDAEPTDLPMDENSPSKRKQAESRKQSQSPRRSAPVIGQHEQTGNATEVSDMSFWENITDERLAAKMTPSAQLKHMQKLETSKPILFNQGTRPSNQYDDDTRSTGSAGSHHSRMPQSFRLANKGMPNGISHSNSDASSNGQHRSKAFSKADTAGPKQTGTGPKPQPEAAKPAARVRKPQEVDDDDDDDDDGDETSDELKGAESVFSLNQLRKKIKGRPVADEDAEPPSQNDGDQPDHEQDAAVDDDSTQHSQQSNTPNDAQPLSEEKPQRNPVPATSKGVFNMWRRKTAEGRSERTSSFSSKASSQVNWDAVGANVALPSVENQESLTPQATPPKRRTPELHKSSRSPAKGKPFDNDFTSNSFQVSESPPVRNVKHKKSMEDYVNDRELADVNKSAVASKRLGEIREKDPREAQRRFSRSPGALQALEDTTDQQVEVADDSNQNVGIPIPDTPVVLYRSSSSSSRNTTSTERPGHDRRTSHDHLQRLARAMSTTPRSSPPQKSAEESKTDDVTKDSLASSADAPELDERPETRKPTVAATPRVMGAWTDTILPDTTKTARQTGVRLSKYAQTPYVSAGGWVDTPIATGQRQSSGLAPMTIEEVTEELDTDVGRKPGTATQKPQLPSQQPTPPADEQPKHQTRLPRSALAAILDEQKQRLVSADITTAAQGSNTDTLNLGDATIASLEDLVGEFTDNDMSTILRLGAQQDLLDQTDLPDDQIEAEVAMLDRLGGKLFTLQGHLQMARKGISKLEHQVNHASSFKGEDARRLLQQSYQLPSPLTTNPQAYPNSIIPFVYSTITLPVPLLFRPRTSIKSRSSITSALGKPTILGWLVITAWIWYILEIFLSELYSHPLQAERYSWPPVDRPEPSFGFVLPTLLLRLFAVNAQLDGLGNLVWGMVQPMWVMSRAVYRVMGMWVGWTDGFVDDGREAVRNATRLVKGVVETVLPSVAAAAGVDGWSMMDDEIM